LENFSGKVLGVLRLAVALIATLAVLLTGGMSPAGAHQRSVESVTPTPLSGPAALDGFEVRQAVGAQDSTEVSWPFALAIAFAVTVIARRRSRKLVVVALVVVLAVFAVESARHSVHHGLNEQPAACPTALVAAHLSGAPVEALTLEVPILMIGTRLDPLDPRVSPLASADPKYGRAPPSALV
jgi:hypothetical protein